MNSKRRVEYNYFYDHLYEALIAIGLYGAMGNVIRIGMNRNEY